ncbi:sugar ABC transporter substrate-binding protein [Cypionkella sp.]|jgi:multiple sugar transport system substrate-binding protein|uniref:ABC transporter substrate-binding protein n=1 Tax=Cypionkella sp. TaxID=2811411 RepID=UPI0027491906|nr:sugar ABC transporter substrate-binding protein [Cypionkella sp.]
MTSIKTLSVAAALLAGSALSAQAEELHFIMCGGEVRPADQKVIDTFIGENPGVTVNMEAVEWGTCQDKSMQLAAAGDPPSLAYMGSRTLRQLAKNDLIVPVSFTPEEQAKFQPGVLSTVSSGGQYWGIPHAFSTKALYINCAVVEAAGAACKAPETYADLVALAKTVTDNTDAAGIGIAGKDFDNTMHMFLDFLYSNDGLVFDAEGKPALDSKNTRETLQLYADLLPYMQSGPIEWERDQMKDLFNDGQIAMYVTGPWGKGQHAEKVPSQMIVPIPHGPSGDSGTILITDSIAVFKGTGHEDLAVKLAKALTSGEAQYDLDSTWGLTPILDYQKAGMSEVYYTQDPWPVFVAGISTGGPEPMVEDFKSLQAVFTNMVQGILLGEGSVDELVTIAGQELAAVR